MGNDQESEEIAGERRQRTAEEKRQLVEATLVTGASVTAVAKAHGVNSSQLFKWRRQHRRGLLGAERGGGNALLPVRISKAVKRRGKKEAAHPPVAGTPGIIIVEFARGRLRMEGAIDAALFGELLEALAG